MPIRKKKIVEPVGEPMAPSTENIGITSGPMSRASIDIESIIPKTEVIETPDKPRIIGGICEHCGTGTECIHYPELNGTA